MHRFLTGKKIKKSKDEEDCVLDVVKPLFVLKQKIKLILSEIYIKSKRRGENQSFSTSVISLYKYSKMRLSETLHQITS